MASSQFFREMDARFRVEMARSMGCEAEDFATETLRVVTQEDPGHERGRFIALVCTWGTGTVLSVVPELLEWAEANRPDVHFRSMHFRYLAGLLEEGQRLGVGSSMRFPQLNFLPAKAPAKGGLRRLAAVRRIEGQELEAIRATKVFHNALDDPPGPAYGYAAFNSAGEAIAVAGAWHYQDSDMVEIGVDVVRGQRGAGLAPAVVLATTEAILAEGRLPFYACSPTNVRSHRTALTCGFLPAFSMASVNRDKPTA